MRFVKDGWLPDQEQTTSRNPENATVCVKGGGSAEVFNRSNNRRMNEIIISRTSKGNEHIFRPIRDCIEHIIFSVSLIPSGNENPPPYERRV